MNIESITSVLPRHWDSAMTFDQFMEEAQKNKSFWEASYRTARVPDEFIQRADRLPANRRLLVLLEDWCGDAVSTVPLIARLAESSDCLDLRVLARDTNLDLMDQHLTRGSRSIPLVIVTDDDLAVLGTWGPRPAELQEWFYTDGYAIEKAERYKHMRTWYARDRGLSTLDEVLRVAEADPAPV